MPATATASQLITELQELDCLNISRPDDDSYLLPSAAWIADFAGYLDQNRLKLWPRLVDVAAPQKGDCDEIAEIALAEADKAIMLSDVEGDFGGAVFTADIFIRLQTTLFEVYEGPANHKLLLIRSPDEWIALDPWTTLYEPFKDLKDAGIVGALLDVEL